MRLYGSFTSPYVRRVRFLGLELGVPLDLVDVTTDEGQRELRERTPIWKVPAIELDGRVLWETNVILDRLLDEHGYASLRAPAADTRYEELSFRAAVDECLATLVKLFYLRRDQVAVSGVPYLVKDQERVRSILSWLEGQLRGPWCTKVDGFGLAELTLYTALDWMLLRDMVSLDALPGLRAFLAAHELRANLVATAPPR